jgi:hypothetical protein
MYLLSYFTVTSVQVEELAIYISNHLSWKCIEYIQQYALHAIFCTGFAFRTAKTILRVTTSSLVGSC